jgi:flagellar secretion chaperone FliS
MFATITPPIEQYRQVGTATAVALADPHQLVILLYDGAIAAVLQARHAVQTGDVATRLSTINKAMRIIDEGLKASVESNGDPALAENLRALYEHMVSRLFQANLHVAEEPLAEVLTLLGDLRSAWAAIAPAAAQHADLQA